MESDFSKGGSHEQPQVAQRVLPSNTRRYHTPYPRQQDFDRAFRNVQTSSDRTVQAVSDAKQSVQIDAHPLAETASQRLLVHMYESKPQTDCRLNLALFK